MSAAGVTASTVPDQGAGAGSTPSAALPESLRVRPRQLVIQPVSHFVAKQMCERHHYLHSYPGASMLNFGVFAGSRLLGVAVLGAGPFNVHSFFEGAERGQNEVFGQLTR